MRAGQPRNEEKPLRDFVALFLVSKKKTTLPAEDGPRILTVLHVAEEFVRC